MIKKSSITHQELVQQALSRPEVKHEYDQLADEYALLAEMLQARAEAGKTQADVAEAMQVSKALVGRLETGGGKKKHSPTLATLRRYAHALGYRLSIKFVKAHHPSGKAT